MCSSIPLFFFLCYVNIVSIC